MTFPLIAFCQPAGAGEGRETFGFVSDHDHLHRARRRDIRTGVMRGMVLIDSRGRAWRIQALKVVRRHTPLWRCALMTVFPQWDDIEYEVQLSLEDLAGVPFSEVQARVCRSIDQNTDDWIDDEAMAGESGPPVTLEQLMETAKTAVRRSTDIETMRVGIHAALP
jgi:hypothetical protein